MKKVIFIRTEQGRCFEVDLHEVASDRANYYVNRGEEFKPEYELVMSDSFEGIDWLKNNMDFYMCDTLKEVSEQLDVSELDIESCDIVSREYL